MTQPQATSKQIRRLQALGALILAAGTLLAVGTPVQAEATLGGFRATTWASAVRSSYTIGTSLVGDIFDTPGPIAQASLDDLGGASFASLPYPGSTGANYPQFTNLVVPAPVPGYPFWVVADQNNPEAAFADPTNSYGYKAKVAPGSALGEAKLRPASGDSAAAGSVVTSAVEVTGNQVVARAQSITDGLNLGALRVASIHSTSVTRYSAGNQPSTETSLTLDGGRVGDLTFGFGPSGLKVQQNDVALPLGEGLAQLNKALEPAKISVRFLSSEPIQGGARSGSFEVRNVHPDATSAGSSGTLSVRFGEVISSVVAEGTSPVSEARMSSDLTTETPPADAATTPGSPDGGDSGLPADVGDPSAGALAPDAVPAPASSSFAYDGAFSSGNGDSVPGGATEPAAGTDEAAAGSPAGAAETVLTPAAPAVQPILPILSASGDRLYGTVSVSVAVLVLLSVLWRRGVQQ